MLNDLYNTLSKVLSWRWPSCEGEIAAIEVEAIMRRNQSARLAVAYKFSVGNDGPYVGEYFWEPGLLESVLNAKEGLHVGQVVKVRYRPDDPSVNTLDGKTWRDF